MKKNLILLSLVAVTLLGLFGCKKPSANLETTLPSINDFTLEPGASQEISFSAHDTWTIAADKEWLTFDPTSGEKGEAKVTCTAADGFTSETAKVTLTFGQGTESVTFNVTRSEKQRSIAFTTAAGLPLFSLEFGESSKTTTFNVTANFNWELVTDENWIGWLNEPEVTTGTLDETTKEYKATITLTVNEEAIKDFYEQKEGFNLTFIDIDAIDVEETIAVSHTFEEPEVITDAVITSNYGQTLTLCKDGNFKDANSASVTFTLTPGEGETDFKAYTVMTDWTGSNTRKASALYTQPYLTFTENEDGTYTLTATKYPEAYTNAGGASCQPIDTKIFVLPSTVYGSWMQMGNIDAQDPASAYWWAFNQDTLTDYNTNAVTDDFKKYAIVINVEQ